MEWSSIFLCLHIIGGFTGLLSGAAALIFRKGGIRQRICVLIFYWGTLVSILSVLLMFPKDDEWVMKMISGIIELASLYFLFIYSRIVDLSIVTAVWLILWIFIIISDYAIKFDMLSFYVIAQCFFQLKYCTQRAGGFWKKRHLIFRFILFDVTIISVSILMKHNHFIPEIDLFFLIFPIALLLFYFGGWLNRLFSWKDG